MSIAYVGTLELKGKVNYENSENLAQQDETKNRAYVLGYNFSVVNLAVILLPTILPVASTSAATCSKPSTKVGVRGSNWMGCSANKTQYEKQETLKYKGNEK